MWTQLFVLVQEKYIFYFTFLLLIDKKKTWMSITVEKGKTWAKNCYISSIIQNISIN